MGLNIILLLLTFLLTIVPLTGKAQQRVVSEFAFILDKADYEKFKDDTPAQWQGSVVKDFGDKKFSEPYKTILKNMNLKLKYQIQAQSSIQQEGDYSIFAYLLMPTVNVDKIATEDVVTERKGNLIVNVKISGQCNHLKLNYGQSYIPVKGKVEARAEGGRLQLKLKSFDFAYDPNLWKMNFSTCKGPSGYGQILKKYIGQYLSDRKLVESFIKTGIEEQLVVNSRDINSRLLQVQNFNLSKDVELKLYPYILDFGKDGSAIMRGLLTVEFKLNQTGGSIYVPFNKVNFNSEGQSRFVIPQELIQKILATTYNNGLLRQSLYSQEIPELKSLMDSRFNQFFVWPDLMNFSKKTNFLFDIYAYSIPEVKSLSLTNEKIRVSTVTNVANNMLIPKTGNYSPYVNFYSRVNVDVLLDINDKGIQVNFSNAKLNSGYKFDQNYIDAENPNDYIDIKELQSRLGQSLEAQQLQYELGAIDLNVWGLLLPQKFFIRDSNLEIIYSHDGIGDRVFKDIPVSIGNQKQQINSWDDGSS